MVWGRGRDGKQRQRAATVGRGRFSDRDRGWGSVANQDSARKCRRFLRSASSGHQVPFDPVPVPVLQPRPSDAPRGAPASPFLRGRSMVKGAKDMRPRRKDERRPTAVSRDSFAEALAVGSQTRLSSHRHRWWEGCPVKKAVTGTPVGEGQSWLPLHLGRPCRGAWLDLILLN